MTEFTHADRTIVEAEGLAWAAEAVLEQLCDRLHNTNWHNTSRELRDSVVELCKDLQDYNDNWEVLD